MHYPLFFGPGYFGYILFMLPAMLVAAWASFLVKGTFARYGRVPVRSGITGAQAAREILARNGISVDVVPTHGFLSDLYDPMRKVIRLSPEVYQSTSVSAIGVACHEAGHAVQHHVGFFPVHLRNTVVPVANVAQTASWIMIIAGFMLGALGLAQVGVMLFSLVVLYQIVTLPVEFDASRRALALMTQYGIVTAEEQKQARRVLTAAALTYVAAVITALMQLIWWMLQTGMIGGRRRD